MKSRTLWSLASLATLLFASVNHAQITVYYGDNDGFGVGQTAGILSSVDTTNQELGEAAFTDQRLISSFYAPSGLPPFTPTGSFEIFALPPGSTITQAVLTLRTGGFDSGPFTLDAPNRIFLDGLLVSSTFINGFSQVNSSAIETRSIVLDASFFPLIADGMVSLAGTWLSEDSGSGSFQVDFLSLEVTTAPGITAVPEPSTYGLLGAAALVGLVAGRRIRSKRSALSA